MHFSLSLEKAGDVAVVRQTPDPEPEAREAAAEGAVAAVAEAVGRRRR